MTTTCSIEVNLGRLGVYDLIFNLTHIPNLFVACRCFLCVAYSVLWSSGCPYDLEFREVKDDSLVLRWASPLYEGQSPVSGYMLEMSQGNQSDNWTILTAKPVSETHYKVRGAKQHVYQRHLDQI